MGFRGEALASIAAIANVELVSKTEEQQVGYKVVVEAGDILSKEEIGCQKGTSITVRNLFFNTPVRYKFLKKDYTESGYIEDVITRIALVNPNIAIKLINTGKTVIQTNGNGDIKSVIYSIYGKDVATGVMPVEYAYDDIQVSGVIGKPEIARSNRSNQLFFVNKRYIKDKTLSAATEQAYKGLIPIGKFGFVVLNITMNPAKVDVNVHPAKLEVRFEDESKIFQSIYHAIKDTLLKGELVASTEKQEINQNKEEISKGLYDFRKNETEKIEQYTNEESKIKTNNIVQDIYNKVQQNAQTQAVKVPHVNLGEGGPVNTADVLEQLKKLQENIQKEVETDPSIKLNSNYIQMREQQGNQTKVETSIENDEVNVKIVHGAVGAVSESDVMLAEASKAIIVAFNTGVDQIAADNAKRDGIEIKQYDIIYDAIEDIERAMRGMRAPKYRDVDTGEVEVREVYKISSAGTIAGSLVTSGTIKRDGKVRVIRNGKQIADVKLANLKRFKDEVKEVSSGYECGISLDGWDDIQAGDILQAYVVEEYRD